MKLIYCPDCSHAVSITAKDSALCPCGKTGGRYTGNGSECVVTENAIVLGIKDADLAKAVAEHQTDGGPKILTTAVIARSASTVKRVG